MDLQAHAVDGDPGKCAFRRLTPDLSRKVPLTPSTLVVSVADDPGRFVLPAGGKFGFVWFHRLYEALVEAEATDLGRLYHCSSAQASHLGQARQDLREDGECAMIRSTDV
jgi:hypothetical protein